jgi:hypothetical protein
VSTLTNRKRGENINTHKEEENIFFELLCMGAFFACQKYFKHLSVINGSFEVVSLKKCISNSNLKLKIKALLSKVY